MPGSNLEAILIAHARTRQRVPADARNHPSLFNRVFLKFTAPLCPFRGFV
jgi:hypothetical protein